MRTGSSVRSVGSLVSALAGTFGWTSTSSFSASGLVVGLLARPFVVVGLFGLDHVDAHFREHREDVLDLLGIDLLRGQNGVDLVMGDVAPLLGGADQRLHGRIRQVKQRPVRRGLRTLLLQHLFLLRRYLGLACHESPRPTLSLRRILGAYAAFNELRSQRSLNKDLPLRRPSKAA